MNLKEIIFTILMFFIGYVLKSAFKESLCSINSLGCFVGFVAYTLPVIIIGVYWLNKIYPSLEKLLK
ncbi:hypothetical protein HOD75_01145 [archaeon]|jgi:hypothetical protein|nr:hypothetical protein [archaeon]MBT4241484.1 hypothetical protein [archaeon]MBT4417645.1 hypothetical protein [archaeon]